MTRFAAAVSAALLLTAASAGATQAQGMGVASTDPAAAPAGTYALDKAHASVTMKIMHLGLSAYTMRFRTVDGSYTYDPRNPAASKLTVTIDPKSIDTGDAKFDAEIGGNFLGGAKNPAITFVSTGVTPQDGGKGRVTGRLSLNGVTRPATLDVIYNGARKGMRGEDRMGFSALATVRRSDFGVAKALPTAVLGDDVNVLIEAEFKKPAAGQPAAAAPDSSEDQGPRRVTQAAASPAPGMVVTRYATVAIVLHWAIAVLLISNIGLAWTFQNIPKSLTTFQLIQLHKSTGILILLLSLARLGWRLLHPAPPYPAGLPAWEKMAATAVQWGFYVVMIGMPLSGWVMVSASKTNLPTVLYGLVPWPHLGFVHGASASARHAWSQTSGFTHGLLAKLAYGLILLHVGAALKHQFFDKDVIMSRMAPWSARR